MTIEWIETTAERYDEMLCILPPAIMTGYGFLVGEPFDHRECRIRHRTAPTFSAFAYRDGKFFEASQPLTIAEFRAVKDAEIH